jgi:hypothetical protein
MRTTLFDKWWARRKRAFAHPTKKQKNGGEITPPRVGSPDQPMPLVDVEFHQTFVAHFQKQGLAGFLVREIGSPHELVGLLRLLAKRIQDILAIFQHNCSCNPKPAFVMNRSGGHDEFDLAVFKISRRERLARHLFDNRPIGEKVFLGQRLRRQLGLQNATLPRIPVRDQKRHRLRSLDDLLFGGFGSYPHPLFLCVNA